MANMNAIIKATEIIKSDVESFSSMRFIDASRMLTDQTQEKVTVETVKQLFSALGVERKTKGSAPSECSSHKIERLARAIIRSFDAAGLSDCIDPTIKEIARRQS